MSRIGIEKKLKTLPKIEASKKESKAAKRTNDMWGGNDLREVKKRGKKRMKIVNG